MTTTERRLSNVSPKQAGGLILCHFSHAEDLLFGIDALRSFHIPIHEVYTPVRIKGLKSRLEIKQLKTGSAILKYGCFGGVSFTSILMYASTHNWHTLPSAHDLAGAMIPIFLLLLAFVFASRLMPAKAPKIIRLPKTDPRFLIVIKTKNVMPDEGVGSFLQYSGSVEITRAVKKMLIN